MWLRKRDGGQSEIDLPFGQGYAESGAGIAMQESLSVGASICALGVVSGCCIDLPFWQ